MDLRKIILQKRDALSRAEHARMSALIRANLLALPEYYSSKLPLLFYSFRSEVDTIPLITDRISHRQPLSLPKTIVKERRLKCFLVDSMEDLSPGAFSIMEPIPERCQEITPSKLDVIIVPGSVFDRRGARLGYGGGFYDRFLSKDAPQAIRIALAFSLQVMDYDIPTLPHDEFMDLIVTENGVIECHERRKKRQSKEF